MLVFVLNKNGKSLMPCSPRKARLLLKSGKAKVKSRKPFTIQLTYGSSGYKQPVYLGIDKGAKFTGINYVFKNKTILSAQINHRTDVSDKMTTRRNNRKQRRNRLWYRKPKFNNRASSRKNNRLAQSVKTNIEEIIRIVNRIKLPVTHIAIEDVQVDIARLNNPDLKGKDYQKSNRLDENLRIACLMRDNYQCQVCKKKNLRLEAHHIIPKSEGGKDSITNLITLCSSCHLKVHSNKIKLDVEGVSSFKDKISQQAMQGKSYLYEQLNKISELRKVFGYQTSEYRKDRQIEKTHDSDAMCIIDVGFNRQTEFNRDNYFEINFRPKQTRRQYFDLAQKGKGRVKYQVNSELKGFRKGDIVLIKGFEKQINSIYSNGTLAFARVKGEPSTCKPEKCKLLEKQKTIIFNKKPQPFNESL